MQDVLGEVAKDTARKPAAETRGSQDLVSCADGLVSALAARKRFPGLLAMFARLGEQTGQLPVMLARAAQQLSTEAQRRALAMATILEPLLIVVMGIVVVLIMLAVLLPIIQLNTWVR
jgi:general secretion pathway protein F